MDEKSIQRLSRDKCIGKIKGIDQHGPRTLEDMNMKCYKFSKLTLKIKVQRQNNFEYSFFECSCTF